MYASEFDESKYEHLRDILKEMQDLSPGERTLLRGMNQAERNRVRYLLYEWLKHMNMKKLFRIQDEDGTLIIRKLGLPNYTMHVERNALPERLDSILRECIGIGKEEDVYTTLYNHELSDDEVELVASHWKRIMS
jgi:hypothetical protein